MKKPFLIVLALTVLLSLVSCAADDMVLSESIPTQSIDSSSNSPSNDDNSVPADDQSILGAWILTESSIGDISFPAEDRLKLIMLFNEDKSVHEYRITDGTSFELVTSIRAEYAVADGVLSVHSYLNVTVEEYKADHPDLDPTLTDDEINSKYLNLGTLTYKAQMRGDNLVLSIATEGVGEISYVYSPYTEDLPQSSAEE